MPPTTLSFLTGGIYNLPWNSCEALEGWRGGYCELAQLVVRAGFFETSLRQIIARVC